MEVRRGVGRRRPASRTWQQPHAPKSLHGQPKVTVARGVGQPGRPEVSLPAHAGDVAERVLALHTIMNLADDKANRQLMWRDTAEHGTRDVLLRAAAAGQPEKVHSSWARARAQATLRLGAGLA